MLIYLTSGNHSSLTLNLAGPFPVILEKGSSRGKEKANNISGLRRRQGKWYDFIIQEILRIPRGKEGYTLQELQIKRTLMLGLPSFLCMALFPAQPEYCLWIFLKSMLQAGGTNWLKLTLFMLQRRLIFFMGGTIVLGPGRIGVMAFPVFKLCPMA